MFTQTQRAYSHSSYSTITDGVEIRLPTVMCSHSSWSGRFQIELVSTVTIAGITGCEVRLHFDLMARRRQPYLFDVREPSGFSPVSAHGFAKVYPSAFLRTIFQQQRAVVETRGFATRYTSIFESNVIAWLAEESARQHARLHWGLPTSETRSYIEFGSPVIHSAPHPEDHEEMERYNAEMRREEEFKEHWANRSNREPTFAQ